MKEVAAADAPRFELSRVVRVLSPFTAPGAAFFYTLVALALTWPLVTALGRSLPADMIDAVLNTWILAWSADHLLQVVTGHLDAIAGYWHANIFAPAPLALAYSEHLFAQAVQVLPIYAVTRNPILCYNLVFLSTFVLSGLGTFLLARDLTGNPRAAFVAGLLFGFAPYRIAQFPHVQVLSSQWLPFAIYALRRHLTSGRLEPLVAGVAAVIAQNLSCGYYLMFFAPVVALYVVLEVTARGRWRDARLLARLACSAAIIAAATIPFLIPYAQLRAHGFHPRSLSAVGDYSADVRSYLTAARTHWMWGTLQTYPKAEGELFPGAAALGLGTFGLAAVVRSLHSQTAHMTTIGVRHLLSIAAGVGLTVCGTVAALIAVTGGLTWSAVNLSLRTSSFVDAVVGSLVTGSVLLVCSRRAQAWCRLALHTPAIWFALIGGLAVMLSFGPTIRTGGYPIWRSAPYIWLYWYIPGFDGLRACARYGMLAFLALAVLASFGMASLEQWTRHRIWLVVVCSIVAVVEGGAAPLELDRAVSSPGLAAPPGGLPSLNESPVYRYVRTLPADAVIVEFPFGSDVWDVRYQYASIGHWRRLVNGHSGGYPSSHRADVSALQHVTHNPDRAWRYLRRSAATHAIVHESAYLQAEGPATTQSLLAHGAVQLARFDQDVILALPH